MQPGLANTLSADEFFGLVEKLLGPSMAALGYHRIHGSVNDQPACRGDLTSTEETARTRTPVLWFEYAFEAGGDEVWRLVGPRDPESEDEW